MPSSKPTGGFHPRQITVRTLLMMLAVAVALPGWFFGAYQSMAASRLRPAAFRE